MFRLIKLAMYALVGYAIYELYQGMSTGPSGGSRGQGAGGGRERGDLDRALGGNRGRMQTLTGAGEGQEESTSDDSGLSATHRVGRGVTPT